MHINFNSKVVKINLDRKAIKSLIKGLISLSLLFLSGIAVSAKLKSDNMENSILKREQQTQPLWNYFEHNLKIHGIKKDDLSPKLVEELKLSLSDNQDFLTIKYNLNSLSLNTSILNKDELNKIVEKSLSQKQKFEKNNLSLHNEYRSFLDDSFKGWIAKNIWRSPDEETKSIIYKNLKGLNG